MILLLLRHGEPSGQGILSQPGTVVRGQSVPAGLTVPKEKQNHWGSGVAALVMTAVILRVLAMLLLVYGPSISDAFVAMRQAALRRARCATSAKPAQAKYASTTTPDQKA